VPIYNEETYIEQCISSIANSSYPSHKMEVILVDGMSQDATRRLIEDAQIKYNNIVLIDNPKKTAPFAMNLGIRASSGEYIFILSAHATYDRDYFTKLVENIQVLDASCVGAVLETDVKQKHVKSNAIKEVLMHPFGVGNARFRTGIDTLKEVDTVAFGCYQKSTFKKYGFFDERLTRNQDIELNKRVVNAGGKIYLVPDVRCTYYARETFEGLARNNFANGKWNILTAYYTQTFKALSLRHFVPLLFILSLVLSAIGSLFVPNLAWAGVVSFVSYLALVIIIAFKLAKDKKSLCYLIASFLVLHFSYGLGSLWGLFNVLLKQIKGEDE
jgi:cellulose synthase/poly-beta-1,6-N-acetylglucosamine synthase-like glycosyltransferase